jgi:hypothetical protein
MDTCFNRSEKYVAEALEPVIKFRKNRMFKHIVIREFYSLLRSTMMRAGGRGGELADEADPVGY